MGGMKTLWLVPLLFLLGCNSNQSTPDIQSESAAAIPAPIPTVTVTVTPSPSPSPSLSPSPSPSPSVLSGGGQIPFTPIIVFQGAATIGPENGIIAGSQTELMMASVSAAPAANGSLMPCVFDGTFMAGRCGSWANLGITISGSAYPGAQMQISGVLQFNQLAWDYLSGILSQPSNVDTIPFPLAYPGPTAYGYSDDGTSNAISGSITSITISDSPTGNGQLGLGVGPGTLAQQDGMQIGGAGYALYSGYVTLVVNGQAVAVPF